VFAVVAAIVAYAAHHGLRRPTSFPLHRPSVSSIAPRTRMPMRRLPPTMRRGTYVTSRGRLGGDVSGVVIVEGRWGAGRWYRLAIAPARNGSYRVRYLLDRPGFVHLRIALPDGSYLVATTRVV
jgi:hypothetical protein